jgi:hypothetical protein
MTAPEHLDDDQLTALLDGEGSDDDRAHLDTCDHCAGRAEALRTVTALVGAPPRPPARARDEAVAAALAAAERPVAVVPRPARGRPPAWLLPAAAVVALVALVAVVVPRWGQGDDDSGSGGDLAARAAQEDEGGGGQDDAAERGSAPAPAADAPTLLRGALGELGSVDDEAALAARIDEALTTSTASHDAAPDGGPCDAVVRQAEAGLGTLVLRASAAWQGTPAEVLAYAPVGVGSPTRAVVVALDGCTTLAVVDLP